MTKVETTAVTSSILFTKLCEQFTLNPTQRLSAIITADLRERTGHTTLPAYHRNGATEEEKRSLYAFYLKAIISEDFSELKGKVARGQASVETEAKLPVTVTRTALVSEMAKKPTPQVAPMPGMTPLGMTERVVETPQPAQALAPGLTIESMIAAIVDAKLAGFKPPMAPASISKAEIRVEIDNSLEALLGEFRTKLLGECKLMVENGRKNILKDLREWLKEAE